MREMREYIMREDGVIVLDLVRCKDCKYVAPDMLCGHPNDGLNPEAFNDGNPDFFCAHGERKND